MLRLVLIDNGFSLMNDFKVSDNIRLEQKTLSLINVHKNTVHKFNSLFEVTVQILKGRLLFTLNSRSGRGDQIPLERTSLRFN